MLRYAITARKMFPGDEPERCAALVRQVQQLAAAHLDLLQVRERDLPERELEALASRLVAASRLPDGTGPKTLLNGPAHIAIAAGAHGVHLRGGAGVRELDGVRQAFVLAGQPDPLVSVSCHSLEEVAAASRAGFDLLLFGPVFEKRENGRVVVPGVGLEQLAQAAAAVRGPRLLALGGVTPETIGACVSAGADGVAGIRLFLHAGTTSIGDPAPSENGTPGKAAVKRGASGTSNRR